MDSCGVWTEDQKEIDASFVQYFQSMFTSSNPLGIDLAIADLEAKVSDQMNDRLCAMVTAEEVKEAVFQIGAWKAPGPDGMSAMFYHSYWHIVGPQVTEAVLNFFNSGEFNEKVNFTYIALIPKNANPMRVSEFRPIRLCNVLYKIISEILVNRLKLILPSIISES